MKAGSAAILGACAAWILSAAPFFVDPALFAGVSRAALAALPWIAYAGLPRRAPDDGLAGIAFEIALFAPPLALGAWFDAASGVEAAHVASIAGGSLFCAALSSFAARESARENVMRALYTIAWCTLMAGPPVLLAALVLGGASAFGPAPEWLATSARLSPLQWAIGRLAVEGGGSAWPLAPGVLLLGLCAIGFVARRRSEPELAA